MSNGYEVVTAEDGRDALDRVKATPFDLIITDLKMPGMGGVELTEAIKAVDASSVVVWITAYGCHKMHDEARRLSIYDCLDKPVKIARIRQVVREALESIGGTTELD
jgi:DNA-binding NtrC family response regulator